MASLKNFVRAVLIGLILLAVPSQPSSAEPLAEINIAVIRVSSATLTPSQPSTTIEIVADLPDSALGAASIEIAYDPTIVSLTACALDPEDLFDSGQCNAAFDSDGVNPDRLRFNLISLSGISGEATLSRLTFGIVENAMGSSDISIAILAFATPAGATLPVASSDGRISVHQPLATESTSSSALPDWSPNHLVDGDLASQWSSNGHAEHLASSEWAAVLLTERANIQQIRLYPRYNTAQQA
ncbi:hypothetical protein GC175_31830, partial [bacterium]|nr:hypothetical protein [bacterium]